MRRGGWLILGAVAFLLGLAALILLFRLRQPVTPVKKVPSPVVVKPGRPRPGAKARVQRICFTSTSWDKISLSSLSQRPSYLIKAVERSESILKGLCKDKEVDLSCLNVQIPCGQMEEALQGFKAGLEDGKDPLELLKIFFIPFELSRGGQPGQLLLTGYYQPRFSGSLTPSSLYPVPVLARPRDLVQVRLSDFDKRLPGISLWGRVESGRLVPYYSRSEIDAMANKLPVLCWLKDEVDLLELQIQGSGIIDLPTGPRFIHYAASNGRRYNSLGAILLSKGYLKREELDWPTIKAWARGHRELFLKLLRQNQRYVFFKWEEKGPVGCYGQVLVSGVSVALDRQIFPAGMPCLLMTHLPGLHPMPKWYSGRGGSSLSDALFVLNHDTGAAIKGLLRADLFTGTGSAAGKLAGTLKNRARLLILVPRPGVLP